MFGTILSAALAVLVISLFPLLAFLAIPPFNQPDHADQPILTVFVALAVGSLLGDVFYHLLPEVFGATGTAPMVMHGSLVMAGIYLFFVGERILQQYHHGHGHEHIPISTTEATSNHTTIAATVLPSQSVGALVLLSDLFHNLVDGLAIGVSFAASNSIGLSTSIAVFLHEIPHELGDYAILMSIGYPRSRVIMYNMLTSLAAFLGAIVGVAMEGLGGRTSGIREAVLALTAGNFLYLALGDLMPELLHQKERVERPMVAIYVALPVGSLMMLAIKLVE